MFIIQIFKTQYLRSAPRRSSWSKAHIHSTSQEPRTLSWARCRTLSAPTSVLFGRALFRAPTPVKARVSRRARNADEWQTAIVNANVLNVARRRCGPLRCEELLASVVSWKSAKTNTVLRFCSPRLSASRRNSALRAWKGAWPFACNRVETKNETFVRFFLIIYLLILFGFCSNSVWHSHACREVLGNRGECDCIPCTTPYLPCIIWHNVRLACACKFCRIRRRAGRSFRTKHGKCFIVLYIFSVRI